MPRPRPTPCCGHCRSVILIANEWRSLNADIHALEDRALVVHFDPSNSELHAAVGSWFAEREVYDFIGSVLPYVPGVSIRHYLKAKSLRHAGMVDWKATILRMLLPDTPLACVVHMQIDALPHGAYVHGGITLNKINRRLAP